VDGTILQLATESRRRCVKAGKRRTSRPASQGHFSSVLWSQALQNRS